MTDQQTNLIQQLIAAIENAAPCRITPKEFESWNTLCAAACDALPALRRLAEIEAENKRLSAEWQQCHEQNSLLVSERTALRAELAQAQAETKSEYQRAMEKIALKEAG